MALATLPAVGKAMGALPSVALPPDPVTVPPTNRLKTSTPTSNSLFSVISAMTTSISTCATEVSRLRTNCWMRTMSSFVAITNSVFVRGSGRMRTPSAYCNKPVFRVPVEPPPVTGGGGMDGGRAPVVVEPEDEVVRRGVVETEPPVISAFSNEAMSSAVA